MNAGKVESLAQLRPCLIVILHFGSFASGGDSDQPAHLPYPLTIAWMASRLGMESCAPG